MACDVFVREHTAQCEAFLAVLAEAGYPGLILPGETAAEAWVLLRPTLQALRVPPRRQPTISSVDMCRWMALTDDIGPVDTVEVYTLPAAVSILAYFATDETSSEIDRERAAQLAAWLEVQIADAPDAP